MFKLVVVSGPNRGTSYALQEGETSVGRQSSNVIVLSSSKVSKSHCRLVVNHGKVVMDDLGSSNGTYVNGQLAKFRKLASGDRISVGEYVLELAEAKPQGEAPALGGGQVIEFPGQQVASPEFALESSDQGGLSPETADLIDEEENMVPTDLIGRVRWYFDQYVMAYFYGLNLKYEWRTLGVGLVSAFVLGNLLISVQPLLESANLAVINEAKRRAAFVAKQISDQNTPFLARQQETKTFIGTASQYDRIESKKRNRSAFVPATEGVSLAMLIDLDSRIIAPANQHNSYLAAGPEAVFATKARKAFINGIEHGVTAKVGDSLVASAYPVKVLNSAKGRNEVVAMSLVAIDTSISNLDIGGMGLVYSKVIILTGILGLLIFYILYRLTLKPYQVLNDDIDKALKGEISQVTHEFKFEEMNNFWDVINSTIARIPREGAGGFDDDFAMGANVSGGTDDLEGPLQAIGELGTFGLIICDSDRKVIYMNNLFEEISGLHMSEAVGNGLPEIARDEAFGALSEDMFDRALPGAESVKEEFDFSGIPYRMHVSAFGQAGGNARAYIMIAERTEE